MLENNARDRSHTRIMLGARFLNKWPCTMTLSDVKFTKNMTSPNDLACAQFDSLLKMMPNDATNAYFLW